MLEVELLAVEALVAPGRRAGGRRRGAARAPARVDAAFVDAVEPRESRSRATTPRPSSTSSRTRIGAPEGAWVHYGLTSSDVVDTALCATLAAAMDLVTRADDVELRDALTRRAVESIDWPVIGRTHGVHAEPTTFGAKFALFALQVDRDAGARARALAPAIAVGKLSGAVGHLLQHRPRRSRPTSAGGSGSTPTPATQVVARDRHAEVLYACAAVGTTVESFALEVRHLARSEVGEAEEPFAEGQKGSSAMPHKRNPVRSRAPLRPGARAARLPVRPGSRTSRSGTSATSRTRASSASCCPTRSP